MPTKTRYKLVSTNSKYNYWFHFEAEFHPSLLEVVLRVNHRSFDRPIDFENCFTPYPLKKFLIHHLFSCLLS